MNNYLIIFYNRFCQQTQSYQTQAKGKIQACKNFRKIYPKKQFFDCIESIELIK